jgi:hypothetical protein
MATRQRDRLDACWIAVLLTVLYVMTATYSRAQNADVLAAAIPAWNLATEGSPHLDAWAADTKWIGQVGEHVVSNRLPGPILVAAAFYFVLGRPTSGDAAWPATVYPATVAAAVTTAVAMALLFLALRHLTTRSVAIAATAAVALATSTWSISADGLWTHGPAQLALALALLGASRDRWLVSGTGWGLSLLARPHLGLAGAVMALWVGISRRRWRPVLATAVGGLAGVAVLLAYNRWTFGTWTLLGGYEESGFEHGGVGAQSFVVNVVGTLLSPERGVLMVSPFLLALLPGIPTGWRAAPDWVRGAAVGGLVYLVVQLLLNRFSGGEGFFGYRLPLETLTLAAPLLLLCFTYWTARTLGRLRLLTVLLGLSVATQALGAILWRQRSGAWDPWTTYRPVDVIAERPWASMCVIVVVALATALVWARLPRLHHVLRRSEAAPEVPLGQQVPQR